MQQPVGKTKDTLSKSQDAGHLSPSIRPMREVRRGMMVVVGESDWKREGGEKAWRGCSIEKTVNCQGG